jgi:hypothetical protein
MPPQYHTNARLRQSVLACLYREREAHPEQGWVTERSLKDACGEDCAFALAVLVELGQVRRDGYRLLITGVGVLACEQAAQA